MKIDLYERYPELNNCRESIEKAKEAWIELFRRGGKMLLCGNGGSSADCDHIVGELMKGFLLKRPVDDNLRNNIKKTGFSDAAFLSDHLQIGLPAISLTAQTAIASAFINDVSAETAYAQLVLALAKPEDLLICISTSGNSKNCVNAAIMAKALNIPVISLTGKNDSKLSEISDISIQVPALETYQVQEYHLPVYHYLCAETEAAFWNF